MFCDLVGSTKLSQRLDPEDLRDLLGTYQRICGEQIARYDGHVAQYQGDGIVAYFGFPRAHEDDAERAVQAGLEIQTALAELARRETSHEDVHLEARIGIHTGPVVVGTMASGDRRETLAVGDTTNLAARVQGEAEPGTVVVSGATLRLVPGLFVTESLGPVMLKGAVAALELHRVRQRIGVRERVYAGAMTPLIGREQELALLLDRWERARAGNGQVVMLSAEAGVGKSRLVQGLRERLADTPHTWLDAECSPFASGAALHPIMGLFARGVGFEQIADPAERLAALERLQLPGLDVEAVVPYVAALLQLPASQRYPLPQQSAELQRERTFLALAAIYHGLSRVQPVVFCIEDLHWSDPSTRELLGRLADQAPTSGGLLLITGRPEAWRDWKLPGAHALHLSLTRLAQEHARALAVASLRGRSLPEEVLDKVVARADGIPLFLEELAKSVLESRELGKRSGHELAQGDDAVPATLQDSLTARLDRLSSAKVVAQLAATLGREFDFGLIAAVSGLDASVLQAGLARLVEGEILYQRGTPPHSSYVFKHALFQDTAYQSQLRAQRRERHARAADAIEERLPALAAAEPETLAHHCAEGGLPERAAGHFEGAGRAAIERYANAEAVECFRRGLAQAETLPESATRHQLEITLRVGLGGPLAVLLAYDAPEVAQNYARVRELTDLVGEGPQQLAAWIGLINYYSQCSEFGRLTEVGQAIVRIAEPLEIPVLFALGKFLIGLSRLPLGSVSEVFEPLRPAIDLADRGALPPPASVHEPDMTALAYATAAFAYNVSGDAGEALRYLALATERAEALDHANTIANVRVMGCGVLLQLEDAQGVAVLARDAATLCADRGFRNLVTQAEVYLGWVRAAAGDRRGADDSIAAVAAYMASGSRSTMAWLHVVAADALRLGGRGDEALERAALAESVIARTGEIGYLPWTRWIRGLVANGRGDGVQAERLLREGIERSRAIGHAIAGLRIAISLAELLEKAGRGAEARAVLESWLPQSGSASDATPLARRARALLEEADASHVSGRSRT